MITRMDKYIIACTTSVSSGLMERLSSLGVMDIRRSKAPVDEYSSALLEQSKKIKDTIEGRSLNDGIAALEKSLAALHREYEDSAAWGDCPQDELSLIEDAGYRIRFHILPEKEFRQDFSEKVPLKVVTRENGKVRFVTVEKEGGGVPICPGEIEKPAGLDSLREEIGKVREQLEDRKKEREKLAGSRKDLEMQYGNIIASLDSYLASKASILTEDVVEGCEGLDGVLDIFEGYAPQSEEERLSQALDIPGVWCSVQAAAEDDTPVKLRNNRFISEFEVFTKMYGMPVYSEFDPTPILGPFFLLFFSMCMGDAGYGILLMAISVFLKKKMPDSGLGKMNGLIMILGAGTFIIGLLLGTFFGVSLYDKEWIPSPLRSIMLVEGNLGRIAGFDPQIVIALGIGIFHICLAMIVKTICFTSRTGFRNNLGTWGWTLLVVGAVITAALSIGGLLGSDALRLSIIIIACISGLGIFLFNNPERHVLKNIGVGLWDSYNMLTGLLGDTLSYLRLYALGLAGGMLGGAFNNLATMVLGDNPSWQWAPFILIVVLGHALNLAMSCLGAFVHPLRLSFVEYFKNSGYEGSGVEYKPLEKLNNH